MGADFEPPAWGLAYATRRIKDKTLWGHGGYCPGTRSEFMLRLPDKIGVIGMMTANDVSPGRMAGWIYSLTAQSIDAVYGGDDEDADRRKKGLDYERAEENGAEEGLELVHEGSGARDSDAFCASGIGSALGAPTRREKSATLVSTSQRG